MTYAVSITFNDGSDRVYTFAVNPNIRLVVGDLVVVPVSNYEGLIAYKVVQVVEVTPQLPNFSCKFVVCKVDFTNYG